MAKPISLCLSWLGGRFELWRPFFGLILSVSYDEIDRKTGNFMDTTIIQGRRIGAVFQGQKRNLDKEVFTRKTNIFDTHSRISAVDCLSLYNINNILKYQSF